MIRITVNEERWDALRKACAIPGQNECSICDMELVDAAIECIAELRQEILKARAALNSVDALRRGASELLQEQRESTAKLAQQVDKWRIALREFQQAVQEEQ